MLELEATPVCKKDAMTHFNKGVMGLRIEYYADVDLGPMTLRHFENTGSALRVSHCDRAEEIYSGNDVRGLTMSHVYGPAVRDINIRDMNAPSGRAYGVEERIEVFQDYTISEINGALGSTEHER